jgi:glycosyltransferase involved in cell wall biosynthesis
MRVRVELPEEVDVAEHAAAHRRDEIPDETPYGLHHLADEPDVQLSFRRPLRNPSAAWVARKVRNRLHAHEVVAGALAAYRVERRRADVVLCMDERTGVPAALVPGGAPVVSNIIWVGRPHTYHRAQRAVLARALHRMRGVIAQSQSLAADLVEGWDLDPERVHVVRVGIDPAFFAPQPWAEGTITVGSVGDDPFRDHQLLVEAVRRLHSRGQNVRLELGTTIPDDQVPPDLGLLHRERMEAAVRPMYRRAALVALALHPSTRGSGSTVVLEAAASARAVVATRTPAMAALIEDGVRGVLVEPEDPDALARAVGELLADPGRARQMGLEARRWLEEHHTSAHMAADIRAVLRQVVDRI